MTERSHEIQRLLITTYEYPPLGGGGGVVFRDLAEELARTTDVTVLTSGRRGLPATEQRGRLEILRVPVLMRKEDATASLPSMLSFFPSSLWKGWKLMREKRFDLVHSSFAIPSGPSGLLLARHFRLPHVLSLHGGDVYDPSKRLSPHRTPGLKQTVRWVIQSSDRVVAQSSDTSERARSIYGERPFDCIPLGAHAPEVERTPRAELDLGLSDGDFVLVTVGRIVARKALDELLEVVCGLPEPFKLVVVGEGPELGELRNLAARLGIDSRVRFAGFVDETSKWQILAASDLYVSTSIHEGFGIVFLEAMAVGLPVICYDRGGQTDFVSDEVGRLVPLGEKERFRNEVIALAGDRELRARMNSAARKLASEYSIERYAEQYRSLYAECLESRAETPDPA